MPLHKKTPFTLAEPPQDLVPDELVYHIRFTKEILRDYKDYLNRLNLYRQRVWTCKITGKTNLTYEEALVSERRAAEKVQQFPKELMAPVLDVIQYSTLTLKDLVDSIYTMLHERAVVGLELHGKKEQSVYACKILKILEDGNAIQYEVGWLDKDKGITETSIIEADDLIRKRPPYSRSVLKAFIRESTLQSSPWVIHEKLAIEHGILTKPPISIEDNHNGFNKKRKSIENGLMACLNTTNKKFKKGEEVPKPIKYPIDDLLVQPATNDPTSSDRPSFCTDFKVPMDCVGDLLMIWNFCSSFGRLLNLWRFSLDDFESAICHKESNLVLIVESHAAILRLLIKDEGNYYKVVQGKKRKSKISLITWTEFLCDFLETEGRSDFSKYLGTIRRGHYGLLDINVKLGIFRELVVGALSSNSIRARLNECIVQQQELSLKRREENQKRREEQHPQSEMADSKQQKGCQEHNLENGTKKLKISKRNHMQDNGYRNPRVGNSVEPRKDNGNYSEKVKHITKDTEEKQSEEEQRDILEKEFEKLSIRTNCLGKDRNYNRYWFFWREGRLFVESSDSKLWGYYTTTEELGALMNSLNPKGERERALQKQLEKYYQRISTALQKRSTQKVQLEEGEVRRSTRVRAQPREKPPFVTYVNKWKRD